MKQAVFLKKINQLKNIGPMLLLCCFFIACKGKADDSLTDDSDDTVYISDELLEGGDENEDDFEVIDDGYDNTQQYSGPVAAPDSYKNYTRSSDAPEEFAKASVWHAINMVYPEPFNSPNVEILYSNQDAGRMNIQMKISWSDRWAGPYVIEGILEVNTDGSEGVFTITSKNLNAQSLEFTHEGAVSKKNLPVL